MESALDSAVRSITTFVQAVMRMIISCHLHFAPTHPQGSVAFISLLRGQSDQPSQQELHPALSEFGCLGASASPASDGDETPLRYTPRLPRDEIVRVWLTQIIPRWRSTRAQQRCLLDLGIPALVRGRIWICAIGNEQGLKREHYTKCLQHDSTQSSASHSRCVGNRSDGRGEIQLDVSRTRCFNYSVPYLHTYFH